MNRKLIDKYLTTEDRELKFIFTTMTTSFFQKIFERYPVKTRRFLELIPGVVSWTLISFPIWGSLFLPVALAYFILFFDVYWFYKSSSLAILSLIASGKIKKAEKINWGEKAGKMQDFNRVTHVIIIPNYKERVEKLRTTLQTLTQQTFPHKRLYIVLAMEERDELAKDKAEVLVQEFKHTFGDIFATFHPDVIGEVKGKSSNESYGSRIAYDRLVKTKKIDIDFATISSVDADSIFHPQYFSYLSYEFLRNPKRYGTFC